MFPRGGSGAVSSVFTRTGAVTAGTGDYTVTQVTGAAPLASPALTASPTAPTQATNDNTTLIATDQFVQTSVANAIAGVNPAVAVLIATTAAGDTSGLTYANGVSGVGATLTGTVNTAVTIDGTAFTAVGQRLLVKNDTQAPSGAFNGVYFLSVLQTVALAPVFTRALDYDTTADINNTGSIPVQSGTANALTSWLLTSQVVAVGTTALVYAKFTINPSGVPAPATTVTGPDSYGAAAAVGTGGLYARNDHDHGLPAAPASTALATAREVAITTGTTVVTYTPGAVGNFRIGIYFRVITATTNVTITVTWTDATGAQTLTFLNVVAELVGSYALTDFMIDSTAAAITVAMTAGTIAQVLGSASIGQA